MIFLLYLAVKSVRKIINNCFYCVVICSKKTQGQQLLNRSITAAHPAILQVVAVLTILNCCALLLIFEKAGRIKQRGQMG
jgi:hypothetical protein